VLEETRHALVVAAEGEPDASALAAALGELAEVGAVTTRKLGRFERWRYREQLFGNYA
jgi:hypothetical protein